MSNIRSDLLFAATLLIAVPSFLNADREDPIPATPEEQPFSNDLAFEVLYRYAVLAQAIHSSAFNSAIDLWREVRAFTHEPSDELLNSMREKWKRAHGYYTQTSLFQYEGAPIMRANSLHLIDNHQVSAEALEALLADIDNFPQLTRDPLRDIMRDATLDLPCTGWHAIAWQLFGATEPGKEPGRSLRAFTVDPLADRRLEHLKGAADLLILELGSVTRDWDPENYSNYASGFLNGEPADNVERLLVHIRRELINVLANKWLAHAKTADRNPFTHSTFVEVGGALVGIEAIYTGTYTTSRDQKLSGPGYKALVGTVDAELAERISRHLTEARELAYETASQPWADQDPEPLIDQLGVLDQELEHAAQLLFSLTDD